MLGFLPPISYIVLIHDVPEPDPQSLSSMARWHACVGEGMWRVLLHVHTPKDCFMLFPPNPCVSLLLEDVGCPTKQESQDVATLNDHNLFRKAPLELLSLSVSTILLIAFSILFSIRFAKKCMIGDTFAATYHFVAFS